MENAREYTKSAITAAARALGSKKALAARLGVDQTAIAKMLERARISPKYLREISKLAGADYELQTMLIAHGTVEMENAEKGRGGV